MWPPFRPSARRSVAARSAATRRQRVHRRSTGTKRHNEWQPLRQASRRHGFLATEQDIWADVCARAAVRAWLQKPGHGGHVLCCPRNGLTSSHRGSWPPVPVARGSGGSASRSCRQPNAPPNCPTGSPARHAQSRPLIRIQISVARSDRTGARGGGWTCAIFFPHGMTVSM